MILSGLPYYQLSYFKRAIFGYYILKESISLLGIIFFSIFLLCGLVFNRNSRILSICVIIPYIFIWLLCFSYDTRNLSFIFPVYILLIGMIFEGAYIKKNVILRSGLICLIMLFALLPSKKYFYNLISNNWIIHQQVTAKMSSIGNPELNTVLYRLIKPSYKSFKIISNSPFIQLLPGLDKNVYLNSFMDQKKLSCALEKIKPMFVVVDIDILLEFARNIAIKTGHEKISLKNVWNIVLEVNTTKIIKKYNIPDIMKRNIINNRIIKNHYHIAHGANSILILQRNN